MMATTHARKLLDAALEHLALERIAACVIPVPETDPPLFVAVGPVPAILQLLPQPASTELPPLPKESGTFRGERVFDVGVMRDYARTAIAHRSAPNTLALFDEAALRTFIVNWSAALYPNPDELMSAIRAALAHQPMRGQAAPAECKGCNGHGMVGNILDTDVCPFCSGSGREVVPSQAAQHEAPRQHKQSTLQELVDIAQENDMGYGAPKRVPSGTEFDHSEGGHCD